MYVYLSIPVYKCPFWSCSILDLHYSEVPVPIQGSESMQRWLVPQNSSWISCLEIKARLCIYIQSLYTVLTFKKYNKCIHPRLCREAWSPLVWAGAFVGTLSRVLLTSGGPDDSSEVSTMERKGQQRREFGTDIANTSHEALCKVCT